MDFNAAKDSYRQVVEESIAFAGKGHDFYTAVKADVLKSIVDAELFHVERPRILDMGCGHGYIHPTLCRFGYEVIGIESALDVLPIARDANRQVTYVGYDGARLPFRDGSFDVALAVCVLHHVPANQRLRLVCEMFRVLRFGGVAAIFEHNPLNPLTRLVVARNPLDADADLLSALKSRRLLLDAGFTPVKERYILFTPIANRLFRRLDQALGWLPFGAQYCVTGKRAGAHDPRDGQ